MQQAHDPVEARTAAMHREIAARLRADPSLIDEARRRLDAAIAREGDPADPVLVEWRDLLLMLDADEVAAFVMSDSPRARRLRISSPLRWIAR